MWWGPTSMTKNGLFVLGGPEAQLHVILWAVHDRKNRGRSEGKESIGEFPVTVGGRTERCMFLSSMYACEGARRSALTEPERLHCRLRVTESERSIDGCY